MQSFFQFEIRYWVRQPMTWVFFLLYFLLTFGALTSDFITIGGGNGNTNKNAPLAIEQMFAIISLIGIVTNTSFFNATASRDYTFGMDQIIFASPIKKFHFFFGKFFGVFLMALIPYLGISLAALVAPYMPWVSPERYGSVYWQAHVYGFLLFAGFNTLFGGAIIYAFALYYRNQVMAYLASFGIIILYLISSSFTRNVENEIFAILIDPMGLRAFGIFTKYWSPAQRNTGFIGAEGSFLINRLLWAAISMLVLAWFYRIFKFSSNNSSKTKKKATQQVAYALPSEMPIPRIEPRPVYFWWKHFRFELSSIIRNNSFIILTAIGLVNVATSLFLSSSDYGQRLLPVTYNMVDSIRGSLYLFVIGFMVFYSGYIVFRETEVKINEIVDASPVKESVTVTTKIAAIIASLAVVFAAAMLLGMLAQAIKGYTNFEPLVYVGSFGNDLLLFSFIIILSYLLQTIINNKYLAYFVIVAVIIANLFVWDALQIESNMVIFGSTPSITYSDMNGFGPFIPGQIGFAIYWGLFCALLVLVTIGLTGRGKETGLKKRWHQLRQFLQSKSALTIGLTLAFVAWGGWVYYNTSIINSYKASKTIELARVSYEKKYRQFATLPLPRTTKVDFDIAIYPAQRGMKVKVQWWVKNCYQQPIREIHYNLPRNASRYTFNIPNAQLVNEDKSLYYNKYQLKQPLLPGDSIALTYTADFENKGFENEVSFTQLTHNGTFFNNGDIVPLVGYNPDLEISDKNERKKYGLPVKNRMAKLSRAITDTLNSSYISNSSTWVTVSTTISTSDPQIAVAPGTLTKSWKKEGRNYFHYQLEQPSLNFYSFISANYKVKREKYNGIDVEVYYDDKHSENVQKMADAIKKSLQYYTSQFGPYRHKQCRIIEFPRYASFAQAFPGTMPYSEGIGFISNLRDKEEIDFVTYVVAHEMAHQYWAHQVIGPPMQGSEMFSEGLAQYSALMVMEKLYGKEIVRRFLKYELNNYLSGRAVESEYENPLLRTEGQGYIHYNKASLVYYQLKETIGEQSFNKALHSIVEKYAYKEPPFPTAFNVLDEIRAVTPDSLQTYVTDLFETITLYSNRITSANLQPIKGSKQFKVTIKVTCEKMRSDSLGNETSIPMNDYIDIGLFAENAKDNESVGKPIVVQRNKITSKDNTYTFLVNEKPYMAAVDPYYLLIDKILTDNLKKVK